ncbi:bifunctional serine/threonine-protein kinase/formylglycine-generating enzyme family protein [Pseudoduganella sp. GCM10020061]|uniref:bifunctional serine/threonine-protein kinase/formylglycine-generating enzyme family protein n=1 Tax=Pseudoduganella sp. GCM10020061 TaxID=3317345 RepID=UPI00363EFCD0
MLTAREKIRELRALHEDGLLSLQEFDSRKNAILDAEYAPPGGPFTPIHLSSASPAGSTEIGLMSGMEIGPQNRRYRLERLIATGGMGQVWEALDLATHAELGHSATVAIKILPPQLTRSASHARLLIEEATQARQLAHEHIVRVYEWARDPATASYFIIMEHLDGEDLDSLLARQGKLGAGQALALLEPVAQALDYAWDKARLVHRDIKPGNLFVTKDGQVKLLDFGIASRARIGARTEAPQDSGTEGYRAPEAGQSRRAPARTLDVYAVSVMLYQMLEGSVPASLQDAPRPEALNERQWQLLQRGFAQQPDVRLQTVRALVDALRGADGPSEQELEEQRRQARAREEARQRELAARRRAEAEAALAQRIEQDRLRKEQQKRERAEAEAARRIRKEELRRQLLERRAQDAAAAQAAREESLRKAAQARAAAAYRTQQARANAAAVAGAGKLPAGTQVDASGTAAAVPRQASHPDVDAVRGTGPQMARAAHPEPAPAPASPAPHGTLRDPFLDGACHAPELVVIPSGRFRMGSPEHERRKAQQAGALPTWLERETPPRWVDIERAFALGRHPVTVSDWRQFVQDTGWKRRGEVDWSAPGFAQNERHPVVGVSWHDAQLYAAWLSRRTGQAYRLPTEAEWEYACRAGTKTAFSCGDTISTDLANYDGNYVYNDSPRGEFRRGTTPAGMFPPNPWGLCDMHGNVWEWVQDPVHDNYVGAPANGAAWETGGDPNRRILRGGSWQYSPRYLRSAMRNGFAAALCNDIVGFRVARDL